MATIVSYTFIGVTGRRTVKIVTLTQEEYDEAEQVGVLLKEDCKRRNLSNRGTGLGGPGFSFAGSDEKSAVGEYVASVVTGRRWTGREGFKVQDLDGAEVKTPLKPDGRLKLYKKAKDDVPYILVTPTENHLVWTVQGWLLAREVKELGTYEDPGWVGSPAFFIEQCYLHDIDDLPSSAS